ncbi:MAG: hypothetical protein WKF70_03085 [Chitinophagaceae bacterium]
MDLLFSSTIGTGKDQTDYDVFFIDETYVFISGQAGKEQIKLKRKHDEWLTEGVVDAATKNAAVETLEEFLLSQH